MSWTDLPVHDRRFVDHMSGRSSQHQIWSSRQDVRLTRSPRRWLLMRTRHYMDRNRFTIWAWWCNWGRQQSSLISFSLQVRCQRRDSSNTSASANTSVGHHTWRCHGVESLSKWPTPYAISFTKGQQCRAFIFSLLLARTNCWRNSRSASNLRRHDIHVTLLDWEYYEYVVLAAIFPGYTMWYLGSVSADEL